MLVGMGLVLLQEEVPCSNLTPFKYIVYSPLFFFHSLLGGILSQKGIIPV